MKSDHNALCKLFERDTEKKNVLKELFTSERTFYKEELMILKYVSRNLFTFYNFLCSSTIKYIEQHLFQTVASV